MYKCEKCDKEFNNETSYNQHMLDKHGVSLKTEQTIKEEETITQEPPKKKSIDIKNIASIVIVLILFIAVAWFVFSTPAGTGGNLTSTSQGFDRNQSLFEEQGTVNQTADRNEITNETNTTSSNETDKG